MTEENKFGGIVEGEEAPELVVSGGTASLRGEEVPDDVLPEPETDNIVNEDPPPAEEPQEEAQPSTGGEAELSPFEKEFYEKGLDRQFPGGPSEMLQRVPEMNKYINDLTVERKKLKELQERPPAPEPSQAPSPDDFYNDPIGTLDKVVESRTSAFNRRFDEMEAKAFVNSKSDYSDMEPLMEMQLQQNPGLQSLGISALPILYKMAKSEQLSKVTAQPVPARTPNKSSAETSVGKKSPPVNKSDPSYWIGKTPKEMEEELGVIPKYTD